MLDWMVKRIWTRNNHRKGGVVLEAANFVLRENRRYRATVILTGFETWASNGMIADKFRELGFKEPKVLGSGGVRKGEALWPGPEKIVPFPLDSHLSEVSEIA
jgi:hypothetical protein